MQCRLLLCTQCHALSTNLFKRRKSLSPPGATVIAQRTGLPSREAWGSGVCELGSPGVKS